MAIKTKIIVRDNHLTGGKVASAAIVDLQEMSFAEFCEYLAQDSTVGAADVAAVMVQLEKKLPLILGMGTKVQISSEGMTIKPTVSGSLTQAELAAKLTAKKAELTASGNTAAAAEINVNRPLEASDLKVTDLTAGINIQFSKKFNTAFGQTATFKRVSGTTVSDNENENENDNPGAGNQGGGGENEDMD